MKLDEATEIAIEHAREVKEKHVAEYGPSDLRPHLAVFRNEEHVALCFMNGGSEVQLPFASAAAAGFDADMIIAVSDVWHDNQPIGAGRTINPLTGRPWVHGEMDDVARNHGGLEKGWISEGTQVIVANRAGDVRIVTMPLVYVEGRVVWSTLEDKLREDAAAMGIELGENFPQMEMVGGLLDGYREAMERASAEQNIFRMFGIPIEELGPEFDRESRDVFTMVALQMLFPNAQVALATTEDQQSRIKEVIEHLGLQSQVIKHESNKDD